MPYVSEHPSDYPRRILVAVTGLSPQIVTETLYALAVAPAQTAFVPTEIHLITTRSGAEQALEAAALWLANAGLELNFDKTRIVLFAHGLSFLGVHFDEHGQRAEEPAAEAWLLPPHLRPAGAGNALPPAVPAPVAPKLAARTHGDGARPGRGVRHDDAPPPLLRALYLAEPGAYLRIDGGRILAMKNGEELLSVPMEKVDQVLATEEGAVSFAVLRALLARGAGFVLPGTAGQPPGLLLSEADSRVDLRRSQYRRSEDSEF